MAVTNEKKRDENIDILKGLAIISVVLGHCACPGGFYIYLFHMAVFLMASGYCFRAEEMQSCDGLFRYLLKKLRSLWLPYVIFNSLGWIFYNTFIDIGFLTENPEFPDAVGRMEWPAVVNAIVGAIHFNTWGTQKYFGAGWFIIVLFDISLLFALLYLITGEGKKWIYRAILRKKGIISSRTEYISGFLQNMILISSGTISLYISWKLQQKQLILGECISAASVCYPLYVSGFYLKKAARLLIPIKEKFRWLTVAVGIPFFWLAGRRGGISLNLNTYPDCQTLLLCSWMGWNWLLALAMCLTCAPEKGKNVKNILKRMLIYTGRRSIYILFLHFLAFKPVVALQLLIYDEPRWLLASFPILVKGGCWWIAYTAAGVGLPLFAEKLVSFFPFRLPVRE